MKTHRTFPVFLIASGMALLSVSAYGSTLAGQTVETTYLFPTTAGVFAGPTTSVVGSGVELANFAGFVNIDFSDTNVLITTTRNAQVNNVAFDGLQFRDSNHTIPPVIVTVNPATTYAGFDASRLQLIGDSLFINLEGLPGLAGQVISLDVNRTPATTPEPSTIALIGSGVGLVFLRRVRAVRP